MEFPTILYPPGLPFFTMRQRPQQLMIELAKLGYKCVFGQSLVTLTGREVYLYRGEYMKPSGIHENLQLCLNVHRYPVDHPDEKIILYASSGRGHVWADYISPYAMIYDELDDFPAWERDSIQATMRADRNIFSSSVIGNLIDNRRETFPEIGKSTFVPNACEFEHFDLPIKKENIPPYKIMYVGAFATWLDFQLILGAVKSMPQFEFWFLGARFDAGPQVREAVEELLFAGNVVALPHVPYDDLPMLINDADVLWIPFDASDRQVLSGNAAFPVSRITNATNPIKFWEYLATGKPIVCTPTLEMLGTIAQLKAESPGFARDALVYTVESWQDFCAKMNALFSPSGIGKIPECVPFHKEIARRHTWKESANVMHEVIQDIMSSDLEAETDRRLAIVAARPKDPKVRDRVNAVIKNPEAKELL